MAQGLDNRRSATAKRNRARNANAARWGRYRSVVEDFKADAERITKAAEELPELPAVVRERATLRTRVATPLDELELPGIVRTGLSEEEV
jgi:hypothetical protein